MKDLQLQRFKKHYFRYFQSLYAFLNLIYQSPKIKSLQRTSLKNTQNFKSNQLVKHKIIIGDLAVRYVECDALQQMGLDDLKVSNERIWIEKFFIRYFFLLFFVWMSWNEFILFSFFFKLHQCQLLLLHRSWGITNPSSHLPLICTTEGFLSTFQFHFYYYISNLNFN